MVVHVYIQVLATFPQRAVGKDDSSLHVWANAKSPMKTEATEEHGRRKCHCYALYLAP